MNEIESIEDVALRTHLKDVAKKLHEFLIDELAVDETANQNYINRKKCQDLVLATFMMCRKD